MTTNPKRLDYLSYKTITKHPDLYNYAMDTPIVRSVMEMIHKKDFHHLIIRYIQLRLIGAILTLFHNEPDAIMTISLGDHVLEITVSFDDQDRRLFIIDDNHTETFVFGNQPVFVAYMIQMLSSNRIHSIQVLRSSVDNKKNKSVYLFVREVDEVFGGPDNIPQQMFQIYNTTIHPPRGPA